ncbi:MAG: WhiB family transcriptional regulator [Nocardioidaceae bacterium]
MANLSRLPTPIMENWEWQYDGLCRKVDPEVFFPPDSERGPVRQRREREAKEYCQHCPVLARCREHALKVQEPYGVWGGLTPRERDRILHDSQALPRQRQRALSTT